MPVAHQLHIPVMGSALCGLAWLRFSAHLIPAQEGMPVPRKLHVLVAVQAQAHSLARVPCGYGCTGVEVGAAGLLASKAAAQALHMADHLVVGQAQHVGHCLLVLGGGLQGWDSSAHSQSCAILPTCLDVGAQPAETQRQLPLRATGQCCGLLLAQQP